MYNKRIWIAFLKIIGVFVMLNIIFLNAPRIFFGKIYTPKVPNNFVLRPDIQLQNRELHAGTAFAAKIEGKKQTVIVTAMHLFGPAGGLEEDIPAVDMPKAVKKVVLTDAFNGNNCGSVSKVLCIPDASRQNYYTDVAAFLADKKAKVSPLKISDRVPTPGNYVWLAASLISESTTKKQKLYKAIVLEASNELLSFQYVKNNLVLQATSGAPILNEDGEIVGINIGGEQDKNMLIGYANPCYSFRKMIIKAIKNK